jgi:hypothetical protein
MGKTISCIAGLLVGLALTLPAWADDKSADTFATNLVGAPSLKQGEKAKVTVADGSLQLVGKVSTANIKLSSIEDILTSTETTQAGGKAGTAARAGALAAPYDTGAVLTLILRTKVDLVTVLYRGEHGGLHSVLLTVSKGKAEPLRAQLIAAGAHVSEGKR